MSYFSGYYIKFMPPFFFFIKIFLIILTIFVQSSMAFRVEDEDINPFYELLNREEFVNLAGYGEDKLSTVLITGSVVCDERTVKPFPLSGALVGINCGDWSQKKSPAAEGVTNVYGEFQIDLPSHFHAIPNLDKTCSVEVLRIPESSSCKSTSVGEPKPLKLLFSQDGLRVYTTEEVQLSSFKEQRTQ